MKEKFYFPHDYEASNDPKLMALLSLHGGIGYGVYWRVVEMLHSEENHKLPLKEYLYIALAEQMKISSEQVQIIIQTCIEKCELYEGDENFFWCQRVDRNILTRSNISKKRSDAGKKSAENKRVTTSVQQVSTSVEQNSTNVNKGKESKVKEKKVKEKKDISREIEFHDTYKKLVQKYHDYKTEKYPDLMKGINLNVKGSIKAIDQLIRIDGFTYDEIRTILWWVIKDEFWNKQILSLSSLRKKGKNGETKFVNCRTAFLKTPIEYKQTYGKIPTIPKFQSVPECVYHSYTPEQKADYDKREAEQLALSSHGN